MQNQDEKSRFADSRIFFPTSSSFTKLLENYKSRQDLIWSKKDQVSFNFVLVHWIYLQLNFQCYLFKNTFKCFLSLECFILKLDHKKPQLFLQQCFLKVTPQQFFLSNPHTEKIHRRRYTLAFWAHLWYGYFKTTYITAGLSRVIRHQTDIWASPRLEQFPVPATGGDKSSMAISVFIFILLIYGCINIRFSPGNEDFKCLWKSSLISFALVLLVGSLTHRKSENTQEKL